MLGEPSRAVIHAALHVRRRRGHRAPLAPRDERVAPQREQRRHDRIYPLGLRGPRRRPGAPRLDVLPRRTRPARAQRQHAPSRRHHPEDGDERAPDSRFAQVHRHRHAPPRLGRGLVHHDRSGRAGRRRDERRAARHARAGVPRERADLVAQPLQRILRHGVAAKRKVLHLRVRRRRERNVQRADAWPPLRDHVAGRLRQQDASLFASLDFVPRSDAADGAEKAAGFGAPNARG